MTNLEAVDAKVERARIELRLLKADIVEQPPATAGIVMANWYWTGIGRWCGSLFQNGLASA